jgi:hypothetical protein
MPSVHYLCRGCTWRLEAQAGEGSLPCPNCGADHQVVAPPPDLPVTRCAFCGCEELYFQKDFNRATGIALVALGAVFVPWTYGLSLLAVTIVDFVLYKVLKDVTVCYSCRAVHRGYPLNPAHKPFDLVTHDIHVYGSAPPGAEEKFHS